METSWSKQHSDMSVQAGTVGRPVVPLAVTHLSSMKGSTQTPCTSRVAALICGFTGSAGGVRGRGQSDTGSGGWRGVERRYLGQAGDEGWRAGRALSWGERDALTNGTGSNGAGKPMSIGMQVHQV